MKYILTIVVAICSLFAEAQKYPVIQKTSFKRDSFSIVKFGAKADGLTINTKAINAAIDACSKNGGGVVVITSGLWMTGPVVLKSNVNLHLQKGALLQFTSDFNQYPLVKSNWEGLPQMRNQSPLSANGATNIAITGFGIIDGNGDAWRMVKKDKLTESQWKKLTASGVVSDDKKTWYPTEKTKLGSTMKNPGEITADKTPEFYESIKDFLRPNLLVFTGCKKVLLEGVTFQNSPAWCLHPLMCEDLTVRNISVKNPWYAQNGDGIDVESCKNVLIEGSTFDVGDDGICIKSGRDEAGRKRGMPTENLIARNNTVYHAHGGFVIGSEMSGGARNIFVYDCSFIGTDNGLRFKTARGRGGVVENIYVKNIRMKDIVHDAILFDMYYFMKPPVNNEKVAVPLVTEATPKFQNFYIDSIVCSGAERGIFIRGLPEMSVKRIFLNNVVLRTNKGIELIEATDIHLNNVQVFTEKTNPIVYVENSSNIELNAIKYSVDPTLLLSLNGEKSGNIRLSNTNSPNPSHAVEFNHGANASMVLMK